MATEPVPTSAPVRASDADRERVAAILRAAAGKGLLTLDEVDERLAAVYAATHVADLAPVTADLPDAGPPLAPVDPQARSRARAGVRAHVAGYLAVVALMVGIWVLTGADYYFWPIWPALGMLPGVVSHALAARRAGDPAYRAVSRPRAGCGGPRYERLERIAA
jgi:uncharacterized protein DUF1707/2TM domain-containing protein